jgi:hypothetical protein
VLAQVESGGLIVQSPQIGRDIDRLGESVDRLSASIIFAAMMISGLILRQGPDQLASTGLLVAAAVVLLWILLGGRAS